MDYKFLLFMLEKKNMQIFSLVFFLNSQKEKIVVLKYIFVRKLIVFEFKKSYYIEKLKMQFYFCIYLYKSKQIDRSSSWTRQI